MKRWTAYLVILALALVVAQAFAGSQELRSPLILFGGSIDSTQNVSPWFNVRGCNRVYIRTYSGKAAFDAATDADSTFTDTIAVFKTALTDTILNTNPAVGADSVVITSATVSDVDTTTKMVGVSQAPIQEQLRSPANGGGIWTTIYPTTPGTTTPDLFGCFKNDWMRILITPRRRMTVTGGQSTAGKRVNGIKNLKMEVFRYYGNR